MVVSGGRQVPGTTDRTLGIFIFFLRLPVSWDDRSEIIRSQTLVSARDKVTQCTRNVAQPRPLYDTRCYFNMRSKADMSQLNLPHGTDN